MNSPIPPSGTSLEALVEQAEALHYDTDFDSVKEWKARTGGKAIGYMPIYVPRELIDAAGMLPVGIRGGGDRVEIIRGDAYFQSYICQLPRSTIELALSGKLDEIDGFLFPAICDVIRNMSGMWKVLFPDKLARYLDVPQNFDPEVGGAFYGRELRDLLGDFEALVGHPITDDDLRASIVRYNDNRAAIAELMTLRKEAPWKALAKEAYLIIRAGDRLPVEEHTAMVRAYTELAGASDRKMRDNTRVMLVGSFCEQPPLGLIHALDRAGCYIVWDDMTLGARWIIGDIDAEGDPITALSNAFLSQSVPCASVYEPTNRKMESLQKRFTDCGAEGIVFGAPSFCDPALLDQPMLVDAAEEKNIPWTAFKYAENLGQFQVIREQAGTFADSIRLWSDS